MKKFLYTLLALCVWTTPGFAQPNRKPAYFETNGLAHNHPRYRGVVGHWIFNESGGGTLYDISGNGNLGTLTNGPTWTQGLFGSSLLFDGSTNYVDVGDVSLLELNFPFSVSLWVKPTNAPDANQYFIVGKWLSTGNQREWDVGMTGGTHTFRLIKSSDGGNVNQQAVASNSVPPQGAWTHGVVTVDASGNWVWYFNGSANGSGTFSTTTIFHGTANVNIGRSASATGYFPGGVDNVRIYNRVITADEAMSLYADPFLEFEWFDQSMLDSKYRDSELRDVA